MAMTLPRRRLSDSDLEEAFLDSDDAMEKFRFSMSRIIRASFASIATTERGRSRIVGALVVGTPNLVDLAADWDIEARSSAARMFTARVGSTTSKARAPRPSASEAELINEAIAAGVDLGLKSIPREVARLVDREAAEAIARRRLMRVAFRRKLRDLETSRAGIKKLLSASAAPSMSVLRDADTMVSAFGINERQAAAIANEVRSLVRSGVKPEVIRRQMRRRISDAIDLRSDMIARAIGTEALNAGQDAVLEQAEKQGLLRRVEYEWVTREDRRVCPRCARFAGKRAAPGEDFVADPGPDGTRERAKETGIHPLCRCRRKPHVAAVPSRRSRAA
jgi:Phage Mu protein F like protein